MLIFTLILSFDISMPLNIITSWCISESRMTFFLFVGMHQTWRNRKKSAFVVCFRSHQIKSLLLLAPSHHHSKLRIPFGHYLQFFPSRKAFAISPCTTHLIVLLSILRTHPTFCFCQCCFRRIFSFCFIQKVCFFLSWVPN